MTYMKFEDYNHNQAKRDKLLGIEKSDRDYAHFDNLNAETLKELIDLKFADPEERQNDSPSIQKFYEFMSRCPTNFRAHGYAIGLGRSDYRITIEGLKGNCMDMNVVMEFAHEFKKADDLIFEFGRQYCWYD